ncbi:MAG: hypothetical protein AAFP84_15315, partial [Actinomycetota bacterium]
ATEDWLIIHEQDPASNDFPNDQSDARVEAIRTQYRRADIYAIDRDQAARWEPNDDAQTDGATETSLGRRRSFVEGPDGPMKPPPAGSSKSDHRIAVRIAWDSPTATTIGDAFPTLMEFTYVWTPNDQPLGEISSGTDPDDLTEEIELSRETMTLLIRLTHDHRTGQTQLTTTVSSDGGDGLFDVTGTLIPTSMALAPALMSHLDWDDDIAGSAGRLLALAGLVAFAHFEVDDPDAPGQRRRVVSRDSKMVMRSITGEIQMDKLFDPKAGMAVRFLVDYTCELDIVTGSLLGLRTETDKPLKIRYRDVGIEIDTDRSNDPDAHWTDAIGFVFDTSKMEIEDPGTWSMDGTLAKILRIVEVAVGVGSFWIELRIAVNLTIGIAEVSEAVVRLTWDDGDPIPSFELRGLVVTVDVPNTIEGQGRLELDPGGVVRAGVDAKIIPAGLGASAALAFGEFRVTDDAPATASDVDTYHFLSLHVGVQFSTPLPLAQSGMAIYGFKGLFAMNGQRKLGTNSDPIGRELDWFGSPPEQKFEPHHGQYALGVGAVLGTMPDASFCFSCEGMLVVAFPDPAVILGVKIKIVEVPDTEVTDQSTQSATITGLIVLDTEGVKVGAVASYTIPKVLVLNVPFGAFFPFEDLTQSYVRLGSDGQPGRPGEPITATLLPGTLDVTAWSYLMIEGDGLASLGGNADFTFSGFSIGFGAGWSIEWKAGPIELSASAEVLVGAGTNPLLLVGGVFVRGKLDLVVVSIAASGSLVFSVQEGAVRLEGEFCGEVDLFFFSLSGCVGIEIGTPTDAPPEPPSPLRAVNLTDRRDRVMGVARAGTGTPVAAPIYPLDDPEGGVDVTANNTVWPDTAPALDFAHYVHEGIASSQFASVGNPPTQPIWSGSSELKYAFRLDDVILRVHGGAAVTGDGVIATWMASPDRPNNSSGTTATPSEHEGPTLKLLDWDPFGWIANLDREEGSSGLPGDPVTEVEDICDDLPAPAVACRFGHTAVRDGVHRMRLPLVPPFPGPYPSVFSVYGRAWDEIDGIVVSGRELQTALAADGATLESGAVVPLPFPVSHHADGAPDAEELTEGYRLPLATFAYPDGLITVHPPYELDLDREVATPSVTLLVCDAPGQSDSAGDDPVWEGGGPWGGLNPDPGTGYDPDWPGWPGDDDDGECLTFVGVPIGQRARSVVRRGVRLATIDPATELETVDIVDATLTHSFGSDGIAEVRFPDNGMRIVLPRDCPKLTISLALPRNATVEAVAYTAAGVEIDAVDVDADEPTTITLYGGRHGIRAVELTGGFNDAVVYEICCHEVAPPEADDGCITFNRQGPLGDRVSEVRERGWRLVPVDPNDTLRFVDVVNELADPPESGVDGLADIMFPDQGVSILPPHECAAITVHVMARAGDPIVATAYDRDGNVVASDATDGTMEVPFELELVGSAPIAEVVVTGSSSEGVIYEICCHDPKPRPSRCVDFSKAKGDGKTIVEVPGIDASITAAKPGQPVVLEDLVDLTGREPDLGADGVPEIQIPDGGLVVKLEHPCDDLVMEFFAAGDATIQLTVVQSDGTTLPPVSVNVTAGSAFPLGMPGDDAVTVIVEVVKGGPVHLLELCCDEFARPEPEPSPEPEP